MWDDFLQAGLLGQKICALVIWADRVKLPSDLYQFTIASGVLVFLQPSQNSYQTLLIWYLLVCKWKWSLHFHFVFRSGWIFIHTFKNSLPVFFPELPIHISSSFFYWGLSLNNLKELYIGRWNPLSGVWVENIFPSLWDVSSLGCMTSTQLYSLLSSIQLWTIIMCFLHWRYCCWIFGWFLVLRRY